MVRQLFLKLRFVGMTQNTDQEAIITTLQRLGFELKNPTAIRPEETRPEFILTAEDYDGNPAFSHVLAYDSEMIDEDRSYIDWVHEWARATEREDRVSDVAAHVDFDGGTSWLAYSLDGRNVRLEFEQEGDWIAFDVYDHMLDDFGTVPGHTTLYIDSGQAGVYIWVPENNVAEFTALIPEAVSG